MTNAVHALAAVAVAVLCCVATSTSAFAQVAASPAPVSENAPPPETAPANPQPVKEVAPVQNTAHLMGLNKITARTHPMRVRVGEPLRFGTLGIIVRACHKAKPEDPPKTIAFVEVREYPVNEELLEEPEPIFSGWMLASSPGLNALEHPVYDAWLTDCSISSADGASPSE